RVCELNPGHAGGFRRRRGFADARFAGGRVLSFYSPTAPLALIGPAHLSISLATNLPRYSGLRRAGATTASPSGSSFCWNAGLSITLTIAALSLPTISGGVALGRKIAFQV